MRNNSEMGSYIQTTLLAKNACIQQDINSTKPYTACACVSACMIVLLDAVKKVISQVWAAYKKKELNDSGGHICNFPCEIGTITRNLIVS